MSRSLLRISPEVLTSVGADGKGSQVVVQKQTTEDVQRRPGSSLSVGWCHVRKSFLRLRVGESRQ